METILYPYLISNFLKSKNFMLIILLIYEIFFLWIDLVTLWSIFEKLEVSETGGKDGVGRLKTLFYLLVLFWLLF